MPNNRISSEISSEILDMMIALKDSSEEATEEIRAYLHEQVKKFNLAVVKIIDQEFKDDPDSWFEEIKSLHYIGSGLLGLATAVHRRVKYHILLNLLKNKPEKKGAGPSAAEREDIFRGESSDVEGIVGALEGIQSNLASRVAIYRQSRRKYE